MSAWTRISKECFWVETGTYLRLGDLCCHGFTNKHTVEVVEQSWLEETMLIIGHAWEINSNLLYESPVFCGLIHPPPPAPPNTDCCLLYYIAWLPPFLSSQLIGSLEITQQWNITIGRNIHACRQPMGWFCIGEDNFMNSVCLKTHKNNCIANVATEASAVVVTWTTTKKLTK